MDETMVDKRRILRAIGDARTDVLRNMTYYEADRRLHRSVSTRLLNLIQQIEEME